MDRFAVLVSCLACSLGWSASNVTVTPSSIAADVQTFIQVTASVDQGDQVALFVMADFNGNGLVDGADGPVQAFVVADRGPDPLDHAGRVVDRDGSRNGAITVRIPFHGVPHMVGKFVVVVRDSNSDARATFEVRRPAAWSQRVTGNIKRGGQNQPAVVVGLLDFGDGEVMYRTLTDAAGHFDLPLAQAGRFVVGAFYPGLVTDFANGGIVPTELSAGQTLTLTQPLMLADPQTIVSGRLVREPAPPGSESVPYAFLMAESNDDDDANGFVGPAWTDAEGRFTLPVLAGNIGIRMQNQNERGLLLQRTILSVPQGGLRDVQTIVRAIDAVIEGQVRTEVTFTGLPGGIEIEADDLFGHNFMVDELYTQPTGQYAVGVVAGTWFVMPLVGSLAQQGIVLRAPRSRQITIASGEIQTGVDFSLAQAEAFVNVTARSGSPSGPPVEGVWVYIREQGTSEWLAARPTDTQGLVRFPLLAGDYAFGVENESTVRLGFVLPPEQSFTLQQGEEESRTLVLLTATVRLTVEVLDASGQPIAQAGVSVSHITDPPWTHAGGGFTDDQGRVIVPLLAGEYEVFIWNYPGDSNTVLLPSVRTTLVDGLDRTIRLYVYPRQTQLALRVWDNGHAPVGANVTVLDPANAFVIHRVWVAGGDTMTMVDVPAIPLHVLVAQKDTPAGYHAPAPQTVTPVQGQPLDVSIVLDREDPELVGDLNNDRTVDQHDLLLLMRNWHKQE